MRRGLAGVGGGMSSVVGARWFALACLLASLLAGRPALADCTGPQPRMTACARDGCLVHLHFSPGPAAFVAAADGTSVPAEVLELPYSPAHGPLALVRATGPLEPGEYELTGAFADVVVVESPGAFDNAALKARFTPPPATGCNDTGPSLPEPGIQLEDVVTVTMELGRAVAGGARADVWLLKPGDPVPADHPVFGAPAPEPAARRVPNALDATDTSAPRTSFVVHVASAQDADRVAMRLVEPSGRHSGIKVTALDRPGPYASCACAGGTARGASLGVLLGIGAVFMGSRRRCRALSTSGGGIPR